MESGERLVRTHFQVGLFSDLESISGHEGDLFSIFNSNRWGLEKNKFMQMPGLLNMMPMMWGEDMHEDMSSFKKTRVTLSHEPTNVLPIQGEWKGTRNPLMLFVGRRGQLSYWTPFDGENYNLSIVGQSGSGKSVFMQELMMSVLATGARVFVFDVGRSFEKTVKILGGDYLDFSQKELCINPFSVIDDQDNDEVEASLNMIMAVLSYMVAPETEGRISNEEANVFRIAVNSVWAKEKQKSNIKKIREFLLKWQGRNESQKRTAESLALGLVDYSGEEHSSKIKDKLFNGDANVRFDKSLCVIELEGIDAKLKPVVMQMMMNIVSSNVFLGERKKSIWELRGLKTLKEIQGLRAC
jgi:conjugal transfer ATP-binding protein TraC